MDEQRSREGCKELEPFVRQVREFGGNGGSDRPVRRTGRFLLGAALLVATLLLLTACGGGTETAGGTGEPQSSSGTGEPDDSTGEVSTGPISQGCQPPDMENCYGYDDMQAYADQIVPMVEQGFDDTYEPDLRHPAQYVYVPEGETVSTVCGGSTDDAYEYCPADENIYIGQRTLWSLYSEAGDAAPAAGFAHEWGHHLQNVAGVPRGETQAGQITHENQADCIAGAWVAYADGQGWLAYPDDLSDLDTFLQMIAENEPDRTHGDLDERTNSLVLGYQGGLQAWNEFFPDSPVIASSSSLSASPTATASASPTPSP